MYIEIDLDEHLDNDDLIQECRDRGIISSEMRYFGDSKKLSMVDMNKIQMFAKKFKDISEEDLEQFLINY